MSIKIIYWCRHWRSWPTVEGVFRPSQGYSECQSTIYSRAVPEHVGVALWLVCSSGQRLSTFLQPCLDQDQTPSTMKVYVTTISSQHVMVDDDTMGPAGRPMLASIHGLTSMGFSSSSELLCSSFWGTAGTQDSLRLCCHKSSSYKYCRCQSGRRRRTEEEDM